MRARLSVFQSNVLTTAVKRSTELNTLLANVSNRFEKARQAVPGELWLANMFRGCSEVVLDNSMRTR